MAITVTLGSEQQIQDNVGMKKIKRGTIAFDNSYATNGMTVLLTSIGMDAISNFYMEPYAGYMFQWDGTNKKIKVYDFNYNGATTHGPAVECANATNLATLTAAPFVAYGI